MHDSFSVLTFLNSYVATVEVASDELTTRKLVNFFDEEKSPVLASTN